MGVTLTFGCISTGEIPVETVTPPSATAAVSVWVITISLDSFFDSSSES